MYLTKLGYKLLAKILLRLKTEKLRIYCKFFLTLRFIKEKKF